MNASLRRPNGAPPADREAAGRRRTRPSLGWLPPVEHRAAPPRQVAAGSGVAGSAWAAGAAGSEAVAPFGGGWMRNQAT